MSMAQNSQKPTGPSLSQKTDMLCIVYTDGKNCDVRTPFLTNPNPIFLSCKRAQRAETTTQNFKLTISPSLSSNSVSLRFFVLFFNTESQYLAS